jgi:hypothetical protein
MSVELGGLRESETRQDLAMFIQTYVHIARGLMTGSMEPFLDEHTLFLALSAQRDTAK